MYGFSSYYWQWAELSDEALRALRSLDDASPELPSAGYATHDRPSLLAAYEVLMRSEDLAARGIALDQYQYAEAQGRWGQDNPLTVYDVEVLAQARALIALPLDPGAPKAEQDLFRAAWCSALAALSHLGEASDLPRLMQVLDAVEADAVDLELHTLFWAIQVCLLEADTAACRRVGARLAALFTNRSLPGELRRSTIHSFLDDRLAPRLGQEAALADTLGDPDIRVAIEAAWALVTRAEYQPLVRKTVAAWPDDAPYPASEVRRELDDADQLAEARAAITPPADLAALSGALEAVAELGDSTDLGNLLALLDDADLIAASEATTELIATIDRCRHGADEALCERVGDRLAAVFTDQRRPAGLRIAAIRPFWDDLDRLGHANALVSLLDDADPTVSASAAYALIDHGKYRPLLRKAAAGWPSDAPFPADDVREQLDPATR